MKENLPLTQEAFIKRLLNLCLRGKLEGLPKDDLNRHILLKSVVITMGQPDLLTGKEVDDKLKQWIDLINPAENLDHVTLRRSLVDAGYLSRSKDGSSYQLCPLEWLAQYFESSVDQVDIGVEIAAGREEILRRKREHMQRLQTS